LKAASPESAYKQLYKEEPENHFIAARPTMGLGLSPAADLMSLLNITFFKKDLLIAVGRFDPRYFAQIFRTNLVEPLPEEYTGEVPGSRITGGQPGGAVRSRFRGNH
jgi:hypothetical protein